MSTTPIIFVLVILLFGFDSAGQVKTARGPYHSEPATRKRFAKEI